MFSSLRLPHRSLHLAPALVGVLIGAVAILQLTNPSSAATPPQVVVFQVPTNSQPGAITLGPDGNFWFTDASTPAIGRITPSGTVTLFTTGLGAGSHPNGITTGPDGNLWFTDSGSSPAIGRIDPTTGSITEFLTGASSTVGRPEGITSGPDGNLWFTDPGVIGAFGAIGRITTAGTITTVSLAGSNLAGPESITTGPDGNLWFTAAGAQGQILEGVGKITTAGAITAFPVGNTSTLGEIIAGPDGNLWMTDLGASGRSPLPSIDRITTAGVITKFGEGLSPTSSEPIGIAVGPDGNIWFTDDGPRAIGRITPAGVITEFAAPVPANQLPLDIAFAPSGALFFTSETAGTTPTGSVDAFTLPLDNLAVTLAGPGSGEVTSTPVGTPIGIACGEGNAACAANFHDATTVTLTATAAAGNTFVGWSGPGATAGGCSTTAPCAVPLSGNQDSTITAIFETVPAAAVLTVSVVNNGTITSTPSGISCGSTCTASFGFGEVVTLTATPAAGNVFAGWNGGGCTGVQACVLTLATATTTVSASFVPQNASDVVLAAAVLPGSRSVQVGSTATVFGTMINASTDVTGVICSVQPTTNVPASFTFQATDAQNQPIAPLNAAVPIAPGAPQSFILALTPTAAFDPTQIAFSFSCANDTAPAGSLPGINTLLLSGSTVPVPDVIALAATATDDGIVDIPGTSGVGAFAVASINIGASTDIGVSANLGSANLPVTLTICQTDARGQCLRGPDSSVSLPVNTNDTPTFSIFAQANGAVPFQPATNRIFVQFTDSNGVNRGQTSVAVRTQ